MNFKYLLFTAALLLVLLFKSNAQPFTGAGTAMTFDGRQYVNTANAGYSGTFIDIDGVFTTAAPQSFTVEFWLKPNSVLNYNQRHGCGDGIFLCNSYSNGSFKAARYILDSGNDYAITPASVMVAGTWQHFAFVYNSSDLSMTIYKDGTLIVTSTLKGTIPAWTLPYEIGRFGESATRGGIDGQMDEFRIWNTARTIDQINAYKDKELTDPASLSDLEVYYNFNDLSSYTSTIKNSSGKSYVKTTMYNYYVNAITTPKIDRLTLDLFGGAIPTTGAKIHILDATTGLDLATALDATSYVSTTATSFTYNTASFNLEYGKTYTLKVDEGAFTSTVKGNNPTFSKNFTTLAYLYELNTTTTFPAPNAANIPTTFSDVKIAFTNPTIKLNATSKTVRIKDVLTGVEKGSGTIAGTQGSTGPFTCSVSGLALEIGKKYTVTVEENTFVSSDGVVEEAARIWSFNTTNIASGTNGVLVITGNATSSLVSVVDATTATSTTLALNSAAFTQECWFRFDVLPTTTYVCPFPSRYLTSTGQSYWKDRSPSIYWYNNKWAEVCFGAKLSGEAASSAVFMPNTSGCYEKGWNHFAQVFDGTSQKLYVNGSLFIDNKAPNGYILSNPLMDAIAGCTGAMDEVRIWGRGLSETEIKTLMFKTGSDITSQNGLLAYWNFDDGKLFSADVSGHNGPAIKVTGTYGVSDNTVMTQFLFQNAVAPVTKAIPITGTEASPRMLFNRAIAASSGYLKLTKLASDGTTPTSTTLTIDITTSFPTAACRELYVSSNLTLEYSSTYSVEFLNAKFTDVNGNILSDAKVTGWTFSTVDPPAITELYANPSSGTSSVFSITANRSNPVYYKIVSSTAAAPDNSTILLETPVTVVSGTRKLVTIGNLAVGTYKIYAVMEYDNQYITSVSNEFNIIAPVLDIKSTQPDRTKIAVNFKGDRLGTAYFVAVGTNDATPSATEIQSSIYSTNIVAVTTLYTVTVPNLKKNTAYKLCGVLKDGAGNVSNPVVVINPVTTTNDLIAPSIQSIGNAKSAQTTVTFDVVSSEEGTLYWVVLPTTAVAPTSATLSTIATNGTVSSGTTTTGSAPITYEQTQTFVATNLSKGTQYIVYVAAYNATGYSSVSSLAFSTTKGDPTVVAVTTGNLFFGTYVKLAAKCSESSRVGRFYWVVLKTSDAASAPTSAAELIAMITTPTSAIVTVGRNLNLVSAVDIYIYNLRTSTAYTAYVVMTDGAGTPSQILPISFSTTNVVPELDNADFTIYPNPAKDILNVTYSLTEETNVTLDLYTTLGVKVKSTSLKKSKGEQKVLINVSDLANGTYIYQLHTDNGTISKQLIINR